MKNLDYNNKDIIGKFHKIINISSNFVFYLYDNTSTTLEEQFNEINNVIIPQMLFNKDENKTQL